MPAKIHPAVRKRARELWEKEGYSPNDIVKHLSSDLLDGKIQVPGVDIDKVVLPNHRSVINIWAKEEGWSPHWREARKKANQKIDQDVAEGVLFAISGIKDPIWHLSIVEAQRYIAGSGTQWDIEGLEAQRYIAGLGPPPMPLALHLHGQNDGPYRTDSELVADITAHVDKMLRPGPRVLMRLQPVIKIEIKRARETHQSLERFLNGGDNAPFPTGLFPSREELGKNASEIWEERLKEKEVEEN